MASPISWGYDHLGQVTKADYAGTAQDEGYGYDQIGNRTQKPLGGSPTNYTSNALNQMTEVNGASQSFDADGNLEQSADGLALTWNAENRMVTSTKNGVTTTYQYDYLGRRVSKVTSSVETSYVYDGWNPIAEYTDTTLQKVYTWGTDLSGSLQGAGGVGGLLSVTDALGNHSYPTYDGNGNVSEYLASDSSIEAHYEYDAFGNEVLLKTSGSSAGDFKYKFSTKPQDIETGFYYYGYRSYNSATGTWLTRDPIEEFGGSNLYAFLDNSGISFTDFLGLNKCSSEGNVKITDTDINVEDVTDLWGGDDLLDKLLKLFTKKKTGMTWSTDFIYGYKVEIQYKCCECDEDGNMKWSEEKTMEKMYPDPGALEEVGYDTRKKAEDAAKQALEELKKEVEIGCKK